MEKPILFNIEMVQAILEGRKTCTRRVLKQPFEVHPNGFITKRKGNERLIPYEALYKVDDILYVRETWMISNPFGDFSRNNRTAEYMYKAGYAKGKRIPITREKEKNLGVWKPSIHMPKEAARIFLKVKGVKVERLQDMKDEDFIAEGIAFEQAMNFNNWKPTLNDPDSGGEPNYEEAFKDLWNRTLKKEQLETYGWDANPYVWVINFERVER